MRGALAIVFATSVTLGCGRVGPGGESRPAATPSYDSGSSSSSPASGPPSYQPIVKERGTKAVDANGKGCYGSNEGSCR